MQFDGKGLVFIAYGISYEQECWLTGYYSFIIFSTIFSSITKSGTWGRGDAETWGRGDSGTWYARTSEIRDARGFEDVINK